MPCCPKLRKNGHAFEISTCRQSRRRRRKRTGREKMRICVFYVWPCMLSQSCLGAYAWAWRWGGVCDKLDRSGGSLGDVSGEGQLCLRGFDDLWLWSGYRYACGYACDGFVICEKRSVCACGLVG